jgi:hypothetical protein
MKKFKRIFGSIATFIAVTFYYIITSWIQSLIAAFYYFDGDMTFESTPADFEKLLYTWKERAK